MFHKIELVFHITLCSRESEKSVSIFGGHMSFLVIISHYLFLLPNDTMTEFLLGNWPCLMLCFLGMREDPGSSLLHHGSRWGP
jgi:hypothetical protein